MVAVVPMAEVSRVAAHASAERDHGFPAGLRAMQAGRVYRERDRTCLRDQTGESIALLLRA
jgi:hypothetical protein